MSPSFHQLLCRVGQDDISGATEMIHRRFTARLVALAARQISPQLRVRVTPDEVAESVLVMVYQQLDDLFNEGVDRKQPPPDSWEQLWAFLATLAIRRIRRHAERNKAARRAMDRETARAEDVSVLSREPGPDDVLVVEEFYAQVMACIRLRAGDEPERGERYCNIARELFEGTKYEVIAKTLNTSITTVGRVRKIVEECLTKLLAEDEPK